MSYITLIDNSMKTSYPFHFRVATVSAACAIMLAACGSNTASTSGTVVGSYFQNAKVCADLNNNGVCDAGEPMATTDNSGNFTVGAAGVPIVAEITPGAIRYEPSTGTSIPITSKIVLRAPKDAPGIVSVQSTSVVSEMETNSLSFSDAKTKVATRLNVSADNLLSDYNKLASGNTYLPLMK